jgi:glycosyltransferase involved in cell wall biosynthesis
MTHDAMPAVFNRAAVFVFPSRVEAFGLTCAEAMACGRPVVATTLASGPELVEDGVSGLLADPRDPKQLASRIVDLLLEPDRAEHLGAGARVRALERFDLATLARRNLAYYESIA